MEVYEEFPGCCKAVVLYGFGENDHGNANYEPTRKQIDDKKNEIIECINLWYNENDTWDGKPIGPSYAVMYANTTEGQPATNIALSELGFYTIDDTPHNRNGRKIFPWILPLNEWGHL